RAVPSAFGDQSFASILAYSRPPRNAALPVLRAFKCRLAPGAVELSDPGRADGIYTSSGDDMVGWLLWVRDPRRVDGLPPACNRRGFARRRRKERRSVSIVDIASSLAGACGGRIVTSGFDHSLCFAEYRGRSAALGRATVSLSGQPDSLF